MLYPLILWLLGVPVVLIIVLMLLGIDASGHRLTPR
jgi:hypothetical protein